MSAPTQPAKSGQADPRSMIEARFPHIAQALVAHWHSQETAGDCLNSFLMDDRSNRQGLPAEVFEELMFLTELNWARGHFNNVGIQITAVDFSFHNT